MKIDGFVVLFDSVVDGAGNGFGNLPDVGLVDACTPGAGGGLLATLKRSLTMKVHSVRVSKGVLDRSAMKISFIVRPV